MDKHIDHPQIERKWQNHWENSQCYSSFPDNRIPFTCIAPPANCTGVLHAGHAINNTYIDILARYKRM